MNEILLVGAMIAFIGGALALLLIRKRDMHREVAEESGAGSLEPVAA